MAVAMYKFHEKRPWRGPSIIHSTLARVFFQRSRYGQEASRGRAVVGGEPGVEADLAEDIFAVAFGGAALGERSLVGDDHDGRRERRGQSTTGHAHIKSRSSTPHRHLNDSEGASMGRSRAYFAI